MAVCLNSHRCRSLSRRSAAQLVPKPRHYSPENLDRSQQSPTQILLKLLIGPGQAPFSRRATWPRPDRSVRLTPSKWEDAAQVRDASAEVQLPVLANDESDRRKGKQMGVSRSADGS